MIAAKKNREVAMKYLKDTMSRIREKESKEEDKTRTNLHKRMDALLSLKRNIEFNKENMSALQACERHHRYVTTYSVDLKYCCILPVCKVIKQLGYLEIVK